MDFTNVKLLINPLRQDMSSNVKYFSTGGCYSNSKFFKNDLEGISSQLFTSALELTSSNKKFTNLNGGFEFHENRMIPTIISLKNVIINSLPLNNICSNTDMVNKFNNSDLNMNTSDKEIQIANISNMVMSQSMLNDLSSPTENINCGGEHIEIRKALSPKRNNNHYQLQMKVKNMKKSPNLTFYRNLIEEISAERKLSTKTMPPQNEEKIEGVITPNFVIIENINSNSLIEYEIRFKEAKRKKFQHKYSKCSDNAARFAEPVSKLEISNESCNEINNISNYDTTCDLAINLENNENSNIVDDESDDSFIVFEGINDQDQDTTSDNGCFINSNFVTTITRTRLLSECDSEDSFILFSENNDDNDNYEESSDDESDINDTTEDELDSSPRLTKIQLWDHMLDKTNDKKVHFKPDSELCIIHPMVQWSFAYQNARKGKWEEAARDRSRFQFRLRRMNDIIKPILTIEHRNRIFTERFQDNLNT